MEIMVLGDGRFVHAVLNGVAMVDGYPTLGALGGLVGLVVMAFKGAMSPQGPSFNPMPVLVSLVLFMLMFGTRVDRVTVVEVMPPPGGATPRTYVVDNVPFGLAAAGYFVSNVGLGITGLYDTVMGRPTDEERVLTGGLGRNLMLLSALREMVADQRFGEASLNTDGRAGEYDYYRSNMVSYMADCVSPPIKSGFVPASLPMNAPLEDGVFSEKFALRARHTIYASPGPSGYAEKESIGCADANARLKAGMEGGALLESFDKAAEKGKLHTDSREIMNAFATQSGNDITNAQELVVGHMVSALWAEAELRGSLSPMDRQALVMLEEANMRRTTQWAAEENLFVRLLRPIVGFFEALFYALGPVMAFVVMLGQAGWGLVVKYLMLTVWVALWFPMLTITQLYSKIRMEDYFEQLGRLDRYSPRDLELIANEAMNTLGATSALVAATPALAMSLIYGGAVSMSYLAGRLQHSDVVDEEKMTPKAHSMAPAVQGGAARAFSEGTGATVVGGAEMSIASSTDVSRVASSTAQRAETLTSNAQADIYQAVANGAQILNSGGSFGKTAESAQATRQLLATLSQTEGASAAVKEGASLLEQLSETGQATMLQAHAVARQSGMNLALGLGKMGSSAGMAWSETDTRTETQQKSEVAANGKGLSRLDAIEQALNYAYQQNEQLSSAVGRAAVAEAGSQFASGGSLGLSTEDGERLSRSVSEAQSANEAYSQATALKEGWAVGSRMTVDQLAQAMRRHGEMGTSGVEMTKLVDAAGGDAARLRDSFRAQIDNSTFGGTDAERNVMASFMVLNQGRDTIPQEMRGSADGLVARTLATSSTLGGIASSLSPEEAHRNSMVGGGSAAAAGTAERADGLGGAGVSSGGVRASAAGIVAGATATAAAGHEDIGGQAESNGVSSSTFGRPDAAATPFGNADTAALRSGADAWHSTQAVEHEAAQQWATVDETRADMATRLAEHFSPGLTPDPGNDMLGREVPVSARDWAGQVDQMSGAIKDLEFTGFSEQASQIREAREVAIENMMGALDQEPTATVNRDLMQPIAVEQALERAGYERTSPERLRAREGLREVKDQAPQMGVTRLPQ